MANHHDGSTGERPLLDRRDFLCAGTATGLGAAAALHGIDLAAAAEPAEPAAAGTVRVRQTAGSARHAQRPALTWAPLGEEKAGIALRPTRRHQDVLGFGAAFTDATCYLFNQLAPDARRALFHDLYHPSEMAVGVARTRIGSSD
jgi:glucosylceramidase